MSDVKMTAKQIADNLNRSGGWTRKTKQTSQGYMALCPNHADKNPSLSVRETESGRIMLKCFATSCTDVRSVYSAVESALGMEFGALNGPGVGYEPAARVEPIKGVRKDFEAIVPVPDDAPTFALGSRRFKSKDFGAPVAAWVYRNPEGRPMGYVARYEQRDENGNVVDKMIWPWTFAIREGKREWVVGAMPEPRVPYNLDLIGASPDAIIQWHEGEKAADAGGRLFPNWIPTTTVGGGSAPHLTDFSPFRGRTVILCQDLDAPGSEYVMLVAARLIEEGAEVRILRFPTSHHVVDGTLVKGTYVTGPGDDAADHEERGWTTDLIREAVTSSGVPLTWTIDDWGEGIAS